MPLLALRFEVGLLYVGIRSVGNLICGLLVRGGDSMRSSALSRFTTSLGMRKTPFIRVKIQSKSAMLLC